MVKPALDLNGDYRLALVITEDNVHGTGTGYDQHNYYSNQSQNLPLSGARRIHMFKAQDGTLYVHMMIDDQDYSKFLKNSQKDYEDKLKKSNLSRDNINKSQAATKELFDELEKERGNIPALPLENKDEAKKAN